MGNGGSSLSDSQRAEIARSMKDRYEAEASSGKTESELQEIMSNYYSELVTQSISVDQAPAKAERKPNPKKSMPRRRSFDNTNLPPRPPAKSVLPPPDAQIDVPPEGIVCASSDYHTIDDCICSRFLGLCKSTTHLSAV